ncbi:cofactor assembly of complex C subunit B [Microcoleus sp. FACHB-1515]|uniref:cofactor assembly of complex C subunit B n=1 Tax=Cyanophyceae TaxID=3028117 RepID=UPI001688E2C8|nr:cofactor assembly of complex C subunit B [Microcoleus sp. FACHB-1515]MBD2089434.1 cofactor assembly of complex C subunit B [Microcoleus sp. FACHB-1515]
MPVLTSTLLLTLLMLIGLVFFIRASTKDRIQVARLTSNQPQIELLEQLQAYFSDRAYKIAKVEADRNLVTYEGFVRPSVFLAVFLTALAAAGILCLALILATLLPSLGNALPALALLSPLAGWFYWTRSSRPEQVLLQVETPENAPSIVTVTGHRDELAELQQALRLEKLEVEAG